MISADLKVSIDINGKPVTRKEEKYMELDTLDLKFSTSRLHINLDNLFNGDKTLGILYIFNIKHLKL